MRAFVVKKDTNVVVLRDNEEWYPENFVHMKTNTDNLFMLEDIVIDPVGKIGCTKYNSVTVGGDMAKRGYYGFLRDGWVMLVHQGYVDVC